MAAVEMERAVEHKANANKPASWVLTILQAEMPDVWHRAYVVGRWVWVAFDYAPPKPVRDDLYCLGFRWNSRRKVWQHPGGIHSRRSPADPRYKYGTIKAVDIPETEQLEAALS